MESEMGYFSQAPAFWSCADKMKAFLLERADFLEEYHGIWPHSLKVTTISALMGEIAQLKANLAQLAVRGNYRALSAPDMEKTYSRNLAQRLISVSNFAQKSFKGNQNAQGTPPNILDFVEISTAIPIL